MPADTMLLLGIASPDLAGLAVQAGIGAAVVDLEHGYLDLPALGNVVAACRAAGGACFVRLTAEMLPWAAPMADVGIAGMILSGVRSVADIVAAAERVTFYPQGRRSINPFVAAAGLPGDTAALQAGAAAFQLWAMAETRELLAEARAGAALRVPGLHGLMVGPYDLSLELGVAADPDSDLLATAVSDFAGWAEQGSVRWGMFARNPAMLARWRARGLDPQAVILGYDRDIWFQAIRERAEAARPTNGEGKT